LRLLGGNIGSHWVTVTIENTAGDNPPIGIILAREKDELLIEYAVHGMSAQLFVQKYQLYLPNETELRKEIEKVYEQIPDESN
jgi:YhcG PDDEXK nuclease domain